MLLTDILLTTYFTNLSYLKRDYFNVYTIQSSIIISFRSFSGAFNEQQQRHLYSQIGNIIFFID